MVGFGGFGLGRLSNAEADSPKISVIPGEAEDKAILVVASINGTKFFYPWCSGVSIIKESNLIRFENAEKAVESGYALAKNCKGLE